MLQQRHLASFTSLEVSGNDRVHRGGNTLLVSMSLRVMKPLYVCPLRVQLWKTLI